MAELYHIQYLIKGCASIICTHTFCIDSTQYHVSDCILILIINLSSMSVIWLFCVSCNIYIYKKQYHPLSLQVFFSHISPLNCCKIKCEGYSGQVYVGTLPNPIMFMLTINLALVLQWQIQNEQESLFVTQNHRTTIMQQFFPVAKWREPMNCRIIPFTVPLLGGGLLRK